MERAVRVVLNVAEKVTGIDREDFLSGLRKDGYVDVKRMIAVILKRHTDMRLWQIGKVFGGLDHSTIHHYIKTHKNLMETDFEFRKNFVEMEVGYRVGFENLDVSLEIKLEERDKLNKEIEVLRRRIRLRDRLKKQDKELIT